MTRLKKFAAFAPLGIGSLLLGLLAPGAVASADPPQVHAHHGDFVVPHDAQGSTRAGTYECTGGTVPPGTYASIVVSGVCYMPAGNITVKGNVTVDAGALLDAVTKGDPTTAPAVPAVVTIGGNVTVGSGAVFLFGCSPNITCTTPPAVTYDRIGGSLSATGAQAVVVHSATVTGNVSVVAGGGGGAAESCNAQYPTTPLLTTLEPWSEDGGAYFIPVYSDFEDNTIRGNLSISGLTSCWLGTLRNQVGGNLSVENNTMGDPDAMEIDTNLVKGNMTCVNNTPPVQFGDSRGTPNMVAGTASGQCSPGVSQPNPPVSTTSPVAGIPMRVAVSTRTLTSSSGTFKETAPAVSLPTLTTNAGDTLVAQTGNFAISGGGLTGSGSFTGTRVGQSGQVTLATKFPNGSSSFTVDIFCHCTYKGKTGTILLRAYGTTTAHGHTSGTFLVGSVGGTTPANQLATLVGYGTFTATSPSTPTWKLSEHLALTPAPTP